jgi:hypothetical protein
MLEQVLAETEPRPPRSGEAVGLMLGFWVSLALRRAFADPAPM